MIRFGFVLLCGFLLACGNNKEVETEDENGFSFSGFSKRFKAIAPPYQLTDTGFLKNKDTAALRSAVFAGYLPDSLKNILFGKSSKPKFIPLVQFSPSENTSLFFVKAMSGTKKAALVYAFDGEKFTAVFPFLVPDNDPTTSQVSAIDKSFAFTKTITQRRQNAVAEGKEVYDYDASSGQFSLILTNPLNRTSEVINPIDTFSRKHKFAGDYVRNKKTFVSIRDGRYPNQLSVYVHIDHNEGGCTGELKGELLLTSSNTGVYRQGGDPCVMTFRFTSNSVTVQEDQGCGAHRGLNCSYDGTYPKKKPAKAKSGQKK